MLNTINEIKSELHEIDNYIKIMEEICADNATLIVSSLFGINKELQISNLASERATVNFYGSVPVIVANKNYNKEDYSLGYGNLINVLATAIDCTNEKAKYPSLIRKKSAFLKKIQETMGKKKLIK